MSPPNARLRAVALAKRAARQHVLDQELPLEPEPTNLKHVLADDHDVQQQPSRRDTSFWIALLFLVAPIYVVTPLSWTFILYQLWLQTSEKSYSIASLSPWKTPLIFFCVLEVCSAVRFPSLC